MLKKIQEAEEADQHRSSNNNSTETFQELPEMPKLRRRHDSSSDNIKNENDSDSNMVEAIQILNENSMDLDL